MHALGFIAYVCRIKKSCLCRLKINHMLGFESCVYSWYTGPHGSEQIDNMEKDMDMNTDMNMVMDMDMITDMDTDLEDRVLGISG